MFSLLIVDDHKHQVDTLAITLPWEKFNITTIHRAYESSKALEILEAHSIDIMITDIRMPGTTGLDLIDYVNRSNKNVDCILLTGYAEFEYAKKAIELHAVDYFIKPVRDEVLLDAIEKIMSKRRNELQHHQTFEHATSVLHQNLPLLKENLLYEMLQGAGLSRSQLTEKLGMYQIPLTYGDSVKLMVIKFSPYFYESYNPTDIKLLEFAVMNMAEELLSSDFHVWTRKASQDNLTVLLKPQSTESEEEGGWSPYNRDMLISMADRLLENVDRYLKGKIAIYISNDAQFPGEIHSVYSSILSLVIRSAERHGICVLEHNTVPNRTLEPLRSLYQTPTLVQLMDIGNTEQINQKFMAIFAELGQERSDSQAHIREAYLHVLSCFTYLAHKKGKVLEDIIGNGSAHAERNVIHSAKHLKAWSTIIMDALIDNEPLMNDENQQQLIHKIHSYIQQNLGKDVTLQSISEHVYLHSVYLSKLYKEITGLNLSEYILRIRMEEAKNLLEKTPFKIYEITEKVGYQSPQHFIRRFKQYYGVTPEIYRKQ